MSSIESQVKTLGASGIIGDLSAPISYFSDLILLTKPKIIVLLLISTACPMVLASGGSVTFASLMWALIGGSLVSGSASALNCVWDRDIDAIMERTKNRPLPAGRVGVGAAVIWALLLAVVGLAVLWYFLNPLSAAIALFGHLFYVVVYTMWLKRTTPQNIVIGGAAGAVPPLVGYAAATSSLDFSALLTFLVIFLWTPPHFWALALNKNADYQRAGVPMLPVVAGERKTHAQMLWYTASLLPISLLLVAVNPYLGWLSLIGLGGLGIVFFVKVYKLSVSAAEEEHTRRAWDVFGFSLIYLAAFFVILVLDATAF